MLLSNSSLPSEGFAQIVTQYNGTKSVCWQSLKNNADDVICRQLGYTSLASHFNKSDPSNRAVEIFSGNIDCNFREKYLSQCSITTSIQACTQLSYIKCK